MGSNFIIRKLRKKKLNYEINSYARNLTTIEIVKRAKNSYLSNNCTEKMAK